MSAFSRPVPRSLFPASWLFVTLLAFDMNAGSAADLSEYRGPATVIRTNGKELRGTIVSIKKSDIQFNVRGAILKLKGTDVKELRIKGQTYSFDKQNATFELVVAQRNRGVLAAPPVEPARKKPENVADDGAKVAEPPPEPAAPAKPSPDSIVTWGVPSRSDPSSNPLGFLDRYARWASEQEGATIVGVMGKHMRARDTDKKRVALFESTGYSNSQLERSLRLDQRDEIVQKVREVAKANKVVTVYESGGGVIRDAVLGDPFHSLELRIYGKAATVIADKDSPEEEFRKNLPSFVSLLENHGAFFLRFMVDETCLALPMVEVLGLEQDGELIYGERSTEEQQEPVKESHEAYLAKWKEIGQEYMRLKREAFQDLNAAFLEALEKSVQDAIGAVMDGGGGAGDSAGSRAKSGDAPAAKQKDATKGKADSGGKGTRVRVTVRYGDGSLYKSSVLKWEYRSGFNWSSRYQARTDADGVAVLDVDANTFELRLWPNGKMVETEVIESDKDISIVVP